ncbi:bifunctional nitrate reductase/sulfite reductase flavoprotein subunit alpha [Tatumella citrea]|uniref:assimilatory sulfite reductase (NADPH) n=1 Tax=Tatumella citrea TaxID=53336 RepID=A0A1Y0LDM8_TATCI|nr:bifunctional nitrate reductase/sulfite reductase flavoprotein subunit alpha [Tatumella citrea]ARU95895.1 reductase [Tatumella citrea]ARU99935.1 reductase [Tatumella citrea]
MAEETREIKSVCPYCGVGCGIVMQVADNRVLKVTGDKLHPANRGKLCTKGLTCSKAITAAGRLAHAFLRKQRHQGPVQTEINVAIRETANRLNSIIQQHGPEAVALYVSGQMSLEAQYLANKLAKGFIATPNIESNSRLCMASAGSGYKQSLGADGPPGSYQDFEHADLFLVIGANMADCHPILFLRMMARVNAGARLIVVDTRRTATAEKASLFLQVKSGSDLMLLNGLLQLLVSQGKTDKDFIDRYTRGWEQMPEFLADYSVDKVAVATGLTEQDIRQAADWIGESSAWMSCWTMGLNQSIQGTLNTSALCNLHLATGTICRPGCGPFSLTGQPNAMGGREMGYMGPGLPGQRSLLSAEDRRFTENVWGLPSGSLPAHGGHGTVDMFQQMAAGTIKACWIICTNPAASMANRQQVIRGLQQAELVITQDAFLDTETNRYADVLLPGALWAEAEGIMINSERNVTLMKQAVNPPGDAMADWQIITRVACEMGFSQDFDYHSADEVFREIQQFHNPQTGYDLRGISYARLHDSPVQWPSSPDDQQSRHPIRYLSQEVIVTDKPAATPGIIFPTASGRAQFHCCLPVSPADPVDDDYPFVMNTGRLQHQWHTLTKTGRIPELNQLNPNPFVEIHPQDAQRLNIHPEQSVELRSRRGHAILPARISDRVLPGHCFAPFHWNDVFGENLSVNSLTGDAVDPVSLQPALKYCAVSLTPIHTSNIADADQPDAQPVAEAVMTESFATTAADLFAGQLVPGTSLSEMLNAEEQRYLQGYLAGLRLSPPDARNGIPVLPVTAPLGNDARLWVDGLLAGLYARAPLVSGLPSPLSAGQPAMITAAATAAPVRVLWSSTTGNAESFAAECVSQLEQAGIPARSGCVSDLEASELASAGRVLLVVSTFGDGDPPDNGLNFWQMLTAESAPSLASVSFSVLAFGDSSYDQFCGFGRRLDARLTELGAIRLSPRAECEAEDLQPARLWLENMTGLLRSGSAPVNILAEPTEANRESATVAVTAKYHRDEPYRATLLSRNRLNCEGSQKETRQIILSVDGTELSYQAGDALGIWPQNKPQSVSAVIHALQLEPQQPVTISSGQTLSLQEALTGYLDLSAVSRELAEYLGNHSLSGEFPPPLQQALAGDFTGWQQQQRVVDLLLAFPARVEAEEFIRYLRPMRPRLYSVSSSPLLTPDEIHLTVSVVRDGNNGMRDGVCSSFLADSAIGDTIQVFVKSQVSFRPPDDDTLPLIMIGPGTGIAPFRAFLQQRQASGARGHNWLFFGEQHADGDFYYRQELENFRHEGVLHRLDTAFSRDQPDKIYVQHRMLEQGSILWQWLTEGATVCVCGDASRMAKDVHQALLQIISEHGRMSSEEAEQWLSALNRQKRYLRDVY